MKIGILTFHRAHNYGAVLQCYALQERLKMAGYDVSVIDYRQPAIERAYKCFDVLYLLKNVFHLKKVYTYLKEFGNRRQTSVVFEDFSSLFTKTEACSASSLPKNFDAYIIGSDQLWVPKWTGGELDKVYSGRFVRNETSKLYSYAISINETSINSVSAQHWLEIANNFSVLSFREESMAQQMSTIIHREIRTDIDPTLLLNSEQWSKITNDSWKNEKYLLVYHLPGRFNGMNNEEFMAKVDKIANRMQCKVISLYPMKYSLSDFVSLFKYASGVITSSFHATVFSLIFEKPLMSIVLDDGLDNRYVSLLEKVHASNALVGKDMNDGVFPSLQYDDIRKYVISYANPSIEYLNSFKNIKL